MKRKCFPACIKFTNNTLEGVRWVAAAINSIGNVMYYLWPPTVSPTSPGSGCSITIMQLSIADEGEYMALSLRKGEAAEF